VSDVSTLTRIEDDLLRAGFEYRRRVWDAYDLWDGPSGQFAHVWTRRVAFYERGPSGVAVLVRKVTW